MPILLVMLSNHLTLCHPLLILPSIFPSIKHFSNDLAVYIRCPKYWCFSFSISLPMNIQGWFPLRLTSLISSQSKGLSRVFSSTTVWKHQFIHAQPSVWSNFQYPYLTTGNTIVLTIWTFFSKMMDLTFNTQEDPLEEGMAAHLSVLACRIPMDTGAWCTTIHRVTKSQTQLKWHSPHRH